MIDDRPSDEIEPLVPVMPQSRVRPDGGVLTEARIGPEVLPAEERYAIDPLVPDLS